jgi:WD40 repeat protein
LQVVKVLEGHVGPVSSVAISVDDSKIVTGGGNKYPGTVGDKTVRVWSMETGEVKH